MDFTTILGAGDLPDDGTYNAENAAQYVPPLASTDAEVLVDVVQATDPVSANVANKSAKRNPVTRNAAKRSIDLMTVAIQQMRRVRDQFKDDFDVSNPCNSDSFRSTPREYEGHRRQMLRNRQIQEAHLKRDGLNVISSSAHIGPFQYPRGSNCPTSAASVGVVNDDNNDDDEKGYSTDSSYISEDFRRMRQSVRTDFVWELERIYNLEVHQTRKKSKSSEIKGTEVPAHGSDYVGADDEPEPDNISQSSGQEESSADESDSERESGQKGQSELPLHNQGNNRDGGHLNTMYQSGTQFPSTSQASWPRQTPSGPIVLAEMTTYPWSQFRNHRSTRSTQVYAIDILEGEPEMDYNQRNQDYRGVQNAAQFVHLPPINHHSSQAYSQMNLSPSWTSDRQLPERIRINSAVINDVLALFSPSYKWVNDKNLSYVLTRPFCYLIEHEKEIRNFHSELRYRLYSSRYTTSSYDYLQQNPEPREDLIERLTARDERELSVIIKFIDDFIEGRRQYVISSKCSEVYFSDLVFFYKPMDFIIARHMEQVYKIMDVSFPAHNAAGLYTNFDRIYNNKEAPQQRIKIGCVSVNFDGKKVGPVTLTVLIKRFQGLRKIDKLAVYPLRFHHRRPFSIPSQPSPFQQPDDKGMVEALKERLIERGKKFMEVAAIKYVFYSGSNIDTGNELESEVIVDFKEAFSRNENSKWRPNVDTNTTFTLGRDDKHPCDQTCCKGDNVHYDKTPDCPWNQYVREKVDKLNRSSTIIDLPLTVFPQDIETDSEALEKITDEDYMLMSPHVFAFVLRDHSWARIELSKARFDKNGTVKSGSEKLSLPDGHLDMIKCLITNHSREKNQDSSNEDEYDLVRGKGKGLTILLHGPPGVGKTTTAETISHDLNKPLFVLTCGDLGTTATEAEKAMELNFYYATKWSCIMLLDEAEIFIGNRSRQDLIRNGLVAVFLRTLEYYSGILFLTTNRLGYIDEAFTSRIHLTLKYPPLSSRAAVEIVQNNLDMIKERLEKRNCRIYFELTDITKYVKRYWKENRQERWDGRQIRNICQASLALAERDAFTDSHKFNQESHPKGSIYLTERILKKVAQKYYETIRDINKIHDMLANQRAAMERARVDENTDEHHESDEFDDLPRDGSRGAKTKGSSSFVSYGSSRMGQASGESSRLLNPQRLDLNDRNQKKRKESPNLSWDDLDGQKRHRQ